MNEFASRPNRSPKVNGFPFRPSRSQNVNGFAPRAARSLKVHGFHSRPTRPYFRERLFYQANPFTLREKVAPQHGVGLARVLTQLQPEPSLVFAAAK